MIRSAITFISILLLHPAMFAESRPTQQREQDSLETFMRRLGEQEVPASELTRQTEAALELLEDQPLDTTNTRRLRDLSYALTFYKNAPLFKSVNKVAIKRIEALPDSSSLGSVYWDRAYMLERNSQRDSAYYYFYKAMQVYKALGERENMAQMLGRIANIQILYRDYIGAESNLAEAIDIYEDLEDNKGLYSSYFAMGIATKDQGLFNEAFGYFERSQEYLRKSDSEDNTWFSFYNSLGNAYRDSGDYEKALETYGNALENDSLRVINPINFALYRTNMGKAFFELGRYVEAEEAYLEALEIRDSLGNAANRSSSHYYLTELYQRTGKDSLARTHLNPAIRLAREGNSRERLLALYPLGAELQPDSAVGYMKAFSTLVKQIEADKLEERNRFARISQRTDEYIQENRSLARQGVLYLSILAGVILLGLAIFIIINQRIRNQKLRFEQQQQEANQEIFNLMLAQKEKVEEGKKTVQKRISEELHDGVLGEMNGIRMVLLGLNGKEDAASRAMREKAILKLQDLQEEIRSISHELSDTAYEKFHNFILSMEELVSGRCEASGLKHHLEYDGSAEWDTLPGLVKINLHRIVEESLQNVIKHAKASEVWVQLDDHDGQWEVRIRDNGKGFRKGRSKKGIGQKNIESRVQKMNGTWEIYSGAGKGTEILVRVPKTTDYATRATPEAEAKLIN